MTRLFNDPAAFADEAAAGFAAAHRRWVRPVPGGMVRASRSVEPTVAVIVGGGSGHYPAFAGYVGQGIAHGAVMGNLFASPSAQQVRSVATAADQGRGVLLTFGNYAGDVLNFSQAAAALNASGIPTAVLPVTDDISSAPRSESAKRRGIAGNVVVYKIAGAAAEAGYDLDAVVEVATRANARTRSYGVAFSGCTLPGAETPLFTVPAGTMALGLGIHGEPGIGAQQVPTADDLAALLIADLLDETPDDIVAAGATGVAGQRVAVILNGLGSVKYEELFVVYRAVSERLETAGATIVDPEVGEFVTSFDMAGLSLTLCWLDDELEQLWTAPADTPALRRGTVVAGQQLALPAESATELTTAAELPVASTASQQAAEVVLAALTAIKDTVEEHVDELGRIDAVAGDGDHGIGMQRGSIAAYGAAVTAVSAGAGAGSTLTLAADAWADRAGGTSGALWGLLLRTLGDSFGNEVAPDAATVASGVRSAVDAVSTFGKAQLGDKTMMDVLVPFTESLSAAIVAGSDLDSAWSAAALVAESAATDTATLLPKIGRARPHAERSLGTPDAGAVSSALIARAIATVIHHHTDRHSVDQESTHV